VPIASFGEGFAGPFTMAAYSDTVMPGPLRYFHVTGRRVRRSSNASREIRTELRPLTLFRCHNAAHRRIGRNTQAHFPSGIIHPKPPIVICAAAEYSTATFYTLCVAPTYGFDSLHTLTRPPERFRHATFTSMGLPS
jgi:hypothetical protein